MALWQWFQPKASPTNLLKLQFLVTSDIAPLFRLYLFITEFIVTKFKTFTISNGLSDPSIYKYYSRNKCSASALGNLPFSTQLDIIIPFINRFHFDSHFRISPSRAQLTPNKSSPRYWLGNLRISTQLDMIITFINRFTLKFRINLSAAQLTRNSSPR